MTISEFVAPAASVTVIALTLTPELTQAVSILVAAVGVVLVNLYMAHTSRMMAMREVAKVIAPIEAKINELQPVVEKINTHVNSEKDRAISELAQRDLQIKLQGELIEQMKTATALLAQSTAGAEVAKAVAQAAIAGATVPAVALAKDTAAKQP